VIGAGGGWEKSCALCSREERRVCHGYLSIILDLRRRMVPAGPPPPPPQASIFLGQVSFGLQNGSDGQGDTSWCYRRSTDPSGFQTFIMIPKFIHFIALSHREKKAEISPPPPENSDLPMDLKISGEKIH
jgi:hypothetical protein